MQHHHTPVSNVLVHTTQAYLTDLVPCTTQDDVVAIQACTPVALRRRSRPLPRGPGAGCDPRILLFALGRRHQEAFGQVPALLR